MALMNPPSLAAAVVPVRAGAHVTAAAWLGETPVLALGDGRVLFGDGGSGRPVEVHPGGAILVAASDGKRLITGGDDGRVVSTGADGSSEVIADEKGRWIDALAVSPAGAHAWSAGKTVTVRGQKGPRSFKAPSAALGLAFAPKGFRLAVAHYNGASLWFPNTDAAPEALVWKGSHVDVVWSPDGRFLITSMQENTLHAWRLSDRKSMRMAGYPGKTRSFSWSRDGAWLATSGADKVIVWPFDGKDGPIGKKPTERAVRNAKVSRVAFHPTSPVLAAGYEDGCVMLTMMLAAVVQVLVRPPVEGSAVTALAWSSRGESLLFGCEDGAAGLLTVPK